VAETQEIGVMCMPSKCGRRWCKVEKIGIDEKVEGLRILGFSYASISNLCGNAVSAPAIWAHLKGLKKKK